MKNVKISIIVALAVGIVLGVMIAQNGLQKAKAAGGKVESPTGTAPDRYVYYPGTEKLAPGEIRVFAAGTGLPAARRGQAATCFLIECGNGDKFLFDIGTGSMANIAALMIPYQYLDKIFLSHLHTDHMGDIDALWAGGWTAGRPNALRVWGPSGATEEMGTKYAMESFLKFCNWDYQTRAYKVNPIPGGIDINEFDYKAVNQVVYSENGVTVRSCPAIHIGDGPVSYTLEYAGLKIAFSGDTVVNKWFIEMCKDTDLLIHETMPTPEVLRKFYNQPPQLAWRASAEFHTSPAAAGKFFSITQPRHAVVFHWFNEEGTRYLQYDAVRQTYDGPLSMATDLMVWNVTKDKITERMAVVTEDAWSVPGTAVQPPQEKGRDPIMTEYIMKGRYDVKDSEKKMLNEFWNKYNVVPQPPYDQIYEPKGKPKK